MSFAATARRPRVLIVAALVAIAAVIGAVAVPMSASAAPITLSGIVRNDAGVPLKGVVIKAYELFGQGVRTFTGSAVTSASGSYQIASIPEGEYSLHADASSTTYAQWVGGTTDPDGADIFELGAGSGSVPVVNISLAPGATIAGTVKTSTGGVLKAFTVRAYLQATDGSWKLEGSTVTNSKGAYSLPGLAPAGHRLEAIDLSSAPKYPPTFSGNTVDLASASTVGATTTKITTYNFSLGTAASISGTVLGHSGVITEPLAGVVVTPYALAGTGPAYTDANVAASKSAVTDATGKYTLTGLKPASYALEFSPRTVAPFSPSTTEYGSVFFGGADSALSSTPVTVTAGAKLTGKNITLAAGSTLSGQIVHGAQVPIPNIRVTVDHPGSHADAPGEGTRTTIADASGNWSFSGLGAGQWIIYYGSNVDTNAMDGITEDTSWQRGSAALANGPLTAGNPDIEQPVALAKDPLGLHPTPMPTIDSSNGVQVDDTLSTTPVAWNGHADDVITYQWLRDGSKIPGATQQQYTLTPGDSNHTISLREADTDYAYGSSSVDTAAAPTITDGDAPGVNIAGSLVGTPAINKTVSVIDPQWTVPNVVSTYQWEYSNDNITWFPIGGANAKSYTLSSGEVPAGATLHVVINVTRQGYLPTSTAIAFASSVMPGTFTLVKAPVLTKTASTLSVTNGTWSPIAGSASVHWTTEDTAGNVNPGWTGSQFFLAGHENDYVTVHVTDGQVNYSPTDSPELVAHIGATLSTLDSLSLASPTIGTALDAPTPTWVPAATGTTYQWQYKSGSTWKSIAGATTAHYIPTPTDLGRILRLQLKPTHTGFGTPTVFTPQTATVTLGGSPTVSSVPGQEATVTGAVSTGSFVTVNPGVWAPAPTKFTYQWKTSTDAGTTFTPIAGATATSLRIPQSVDNTDLYVDINAPLAGHTTGTTTVHAGTVLDGVFVELTAPKVTHVGTVYSVSSGTWSGGPTTFTQHWYVYSPDGSTTSFTSPTLDLATVTPNQRVDVEVRASGTGAAQTSSGNILARAGTMTVTGATTITEATGAVDGLLTAPAFGWTTVDTPTIRYTWEYAVGSTWKIIAGATTSTYTPGYSLALHHIRVIETASALGYTTASGVSAQTTIALGAGLEPGSGPASPSATVPYLALHSTVTAVPGTWTVPGTTFTYRWQSSPNGTTWTDIAGATKVSYLVADNLFGDQLQVIITGLHAGYASTSAPPVVLAGTVAQGNLINTKLPTVTKSSAWKLTATTGTWNVVPTAVTYTWEVFDVDGATVIATQSGPLNTYTPSVANRTKSIRLSVSVSRLNYQNLEVSTYPQSGPKITAVDPLTVTGTAIVGQTLTANSGAWSVNSLSLDYQWNRDGKAIPTAPDAATYLLASVDVGHTISVTFKPAAAGFAVSAYTATRGVILSNQVPTATVLPAITGSAKVDTKLTASAGTWSISGLALSYQWLSGGLPVPGETTNSYLVRASDENAEISVLVTATRKFYQTGQATSGSLTAQEGAGIEMLVGPTAPATAHLGATITPVYGKWTFPVTVSYLWQIQPSGTSGWDDIAGGNGATLLLSPAYGFSVNDKVRLILRGDRPGHASGSGTTLVVLIN